MESSQSSPPLTSDTEDQTGWEPEIRIGMFVPMQMRKRGPDGQWLYRDPTEREIQEYLEAEAW